MKATIYHNPLCGTSRKTLEILANEGAEALRGADVLIGMA